MPNLLPDWHFLRPAGRLIWSSLLLIIGTGLILWQMRKPKPVRPTTWAQAMAGSLYVFAIFALAYAVVPHEIITIFDSYFKWGTDKFLLQSGQVILGVKIPISFTYAALRDIVVVTFYIFLFGINIAIISQWQKRPTQAEADAKKAATVDSGTSRFGRPLKAKA
ncbi:unannotated protein [freshwater metagenome]|uniref:Unannotated protein n=1 Tax=freshwater metagenome TaxID=449393 RepID=A0A6J7K682_9ZZZZ|nr:hypothetical protein [Actinomycetota bacterium]